MIRKRDERQSSGCRVDSANGREAGDTRSQARARKGRSEWRACAGAGLLGLFLLFFPAVVAADPPANRDADWLRRPTAGDIRAAFPSNPEAQRRGGSATLQCIVTTTGAARDCSVAAEDPAGLGFGQAALTLAPQFLFRPAIHDGQPVESGVRVPITFAASDPGFMNAVVFSGIAWTRAPTAQDLLRVYPAGPRRGGQDGHVVLHCFFASDRVQGCRAIQAEPRRQGFEEAAVRLADRFRGARPRIAASYQPENTRVVIPFTFAAASLHSETPVLGTPEIVNRPDLAAIRAAYPAAALSSGIEGAVAMTCRVGDGGALEACQVTSDTPPGQGFAAAALSLAPRFRATLWSADGLPTRGAEIDVSVSFATPAGR